MNQCNSWDAGGSWRTGGEQGGAAVTGWAGGGGEVTGAWQRLLIHLATHVIGGSRIL